MRGPLLGCLLSLAACGGGDSALDVQRGGEALAPLASAPTFTSGTLAIVIANGETAFVSRHATSGNLLVNDVATPGATATTVRSITVTGSSGDDRLVLDLSNGTFAPGTSSGPGITVAFGAATTADVMEVRGSPTSDTITIGGSALAGRIAFNADASHDVAVTGSSSVTWGFSLGGGADVFNAASGANGTASAFTGNLTVHGGAGNDTLTGGNGNDTLNGDEGDDVLSGGASVSDADVYAGGAGADTVTWATRTGAIAVTVGAGTNDGDIGGESDDVGGDVEIVIGGSGDDTFTGNAGNQTFYGGAGNDTFLMGLLASTGAGDDTVYGGTGTDTVSYAARLESVRVTMDLNVANDGNGAVNEGDTVRDDVERLVCPAVAACTVTGNALDNVITLGAGDDVVNGGAGDDVFVFGTAAAEGAGADSVTGGAGVDQVSFAGYGATMNVRMDGVASTTQGKVIATDVEDLKCPTASACTVLGNAGNNRIVGSSTSDTLNAVGGDDFVETSGGSDVVDCGDGSDILIVSTGSPSASGCEL